MKASYSCRFVDRCSCPAKQDLWFWEGDQDNALSVGYRLIDTAQAYFNEEGVGDAIAESGIPREEIFLVTKVWISNNGEQKPPSTRASSN